MNLIDVCEMYEFVEENSKIKRETFHLVKEQTTVKKVAEIAKINPKVNLEAQTMKHQIKVIRSKQKIIKNWI